MNRLLPYFIVVLLAGSCTSKEETMLIPEGTKFTSCTISYYSGFERHFNVIVDSNKIFFIPGGVQIQYGILPDSIFKMVDSAAAEIVKNKTIISKKISCEDCPRIAILLVVNNDTLSVSQQNQQIASVFRRMCTPLYFFLRNHYSTVPSIYSFGATIKMLRQLPARFGE